jgi:Zinc-binding loop region of homing endonuclease
LISDEHALELILGDRYFTNATDCWFTDRKLDAEYVKKNLRRTRSKVEGSTHKYIGFQIGMHVLAVIARGDRALADLCYQHAAHEVSHLCHHKRCFNPEHLSVETKVLNLVSVSLTFFSLIFMSPISNM